MPNSIPNGLVSDSCDECFSSRQELGSVDTFHLLPCEPNCSKWLSSSDLTLLCPNPGLQQGSVPFELEVKGSPRILLMVNHSSISVRFFMKPFLKGSPFVSGFYQEPLIDLPGDKPMANQVGTPYLRMLFERLAQG